MTDLTRVVVLAGGLSHERDVSLRSGRRAVDALKAVGVEAFLADADSSLLTVLANERPDAAVLALHGGPGESGALRTVLELAGVPSVGATAQASRIAFDKPAAKAVLRAAGLMTPDWVTLPATTFREIGAAALLERITATLSLPLMVKPAQGGSALGVAAVRAGEEAHSTLASAMVSAFSYDEDVLLERFVTGTEVAVSVVDLGDGPVALPAVEIVPIAGVFDYEHRYTPGTVTYFTPARLDSAVASACASAAVAAHQALGLRDLSRTDIIIDSAGVPWILEVTVAPGMTETSLLPMAVVADGRDLGAVLRDLAALAVARSE